MAAAGLTYREYAPAPALRGLVACAWTVVCTDAQPGHRVLPDGCMDVVLGSDSGPLVAGPSSTAFESPMGAGEFAAGLRFVPGVAPSLLGVAACELRDRTVELADVWGARAARPLGSAPDAGTALARLQTSVLHRLADAREPDRAVRTAVHALLLDPGTPIAAVARTAGVGERALHRRFVDHVGYGPKRLARILRLQRLLAAPPEPWARRALAAGYADQAHMTRECVALTGLSPTRLHA